MNILIAVDGSECSEAAVQNVMQTRSTDAQIRIRHVLELPPVVESWSYTIDWQRILDGQRKEAAAFVEHAAKTLRDANFTVSTAIEEGIAKSIIIDAAAKWPADLVVLGSHGRKGFGPVSHGQRFGGRRTVCILLRVNREKTA